MTSCGLTKRGFRFIALSICATVALLLYMRWQDLSLALWESPFKLPPLYEQERAQEQRLPHYKEYERKNVKYFLASNSVNSSGWGNVMEDFVMMGLLAHATNRSYVFDDYVWNTDGSLYSEFNGRLIPSRIPLSAILSGPMVGGPWPTGDETPLSVSRPFFHKVCPNPTVIQVSDINTDEMRFSDNVSAVYILDKWIQTLNAIEDPCVMLDPSANPIFEIWIFGNKKRMLTIWPYLSKSPVLTHWEWSPLIQDAYKQSCHLFQPSEYLGNRFDHQDAGNNPTPTTPIPGLLAIHVRRGDFEHHCEHLAKWAADWNAFNSFPEFRDTFELPPGGGGGETTEENLQVYFRRCYPSIEQIVEKVREVRAESPVPLRYLYVMTNGGKAWVDELKAALAGDVGMGMGMEWERVSSSHDLSLTWEQQFVAQALDMYVAQRADVFIGNGWSSLTSDAVMLRMAQGFDPDTNRFW